MKYHGKVSNCFSFLMMFKKKSKKSLHCHHMRMIQCLSYVEKNMIIYCKSVNYIIILAWSDIKARGNARLWMHSAYKQQNNSGTADWYQIYKHPLTNVSKALIINFMTSSLLSCSFPPTVYVKCVWENVHLLWQNLTGQWSNTGKSCCTILLLANVMSGGKYVPAGKEKHGSFAYDGSYYATF